ncbi:heme-copper oxidase subunit III [bacterium]|nr:heme-copper oxidase subunit III [bacterium]
MTASKQAGGVEPGASPSNGAPEEHEEHASPAAGMGVFLMGLSIASLSILFFASIIGYFVVRSGVEQKFGAWPPPGMPPLPASLWLSTLILLISSGTMHWALISARGGKQPALRVAMVATTLLGLAFLTSQVFVWLGLIAAQMTAKSNLYGFMFYMLTGLHGAHVVGGVIPLMLVTAKAYRGAYTAASHEGVKICGMYWHFLDVAWLVIFAVLILGG